MSGPFSHWGGPGALKPEAILNLRKEVFYNTSGSLDGRKEETEEIVTFLLNGTGRNPNAVQEEV